ncbi:MAG: VOC family protein [Deltaproteobacteria bacterium]|nr:VOC family protein [Deltaproteobacteria bacterium]
MKVIKIDHIGIAVTSINKGKKFWGDILGLWLEDSEVMADEKLITAFFPIGESEVELLL